MMTHVFIGKKLYIQVIEHTKIFFSYHIYNCFKFEQTQRLHDFCHFKLPSAPTQDKFLDFLQHDFSKLNLLQNFFSLNGGKRIALAWARRGPHPHSKKNFLEEDLALKYYVAKSQRVGADESLKWQNIV